MNASALKQLNALQTWLISLLKYRGSFLILRINTIIHFLIFKTLRCFFFNPPVFRLRTGKKKNNKRNRRKHMAGGNASHSTSCTWAAMVSVTLDPENYSDPGICLCAQQLADAQTGAPSPRRQLLPNARIAVLEHIDAKRALKKKKRRKSRRRRIRIRNEKTLTCVHLWIVGNRFRIGENIHRRRDVLFWVETVRDRVY